jgi:hypothetical protein
LIVALSITELQMVKNDILRCFQHIDISSFDLHKHLRNVLFLIFLRNAGFYLFFTVLKLYQQVKATALIEKKEALKHDGLILLMPLRGAPVAINIKYVCYFSHEKNYTFIHNTEGKTISTYSTLSNIQEYLGDYCLRINKENVITYTNIISYNKEGVVVKWKNPHKTVTLPYYKKDAPSVLQALRKKVPELEEKSINFANKIQNGTIKEDEKKAIGTINEVILEEIKNNPGIYVIHLAQKLHEKMSLRTLKRKLNDLKKSGHIEFRGSKKTGGYYTAWQAWTKKPSLPVC